MFDNVVEKIDKTYNRCFIFGIITTVFVAIFLILSFLTSALHATYSAFSVGVAEQFSKGFSSIINIIISVILLVLCIITIVASKKRKKLGLQCGSLIGFIFFAFSAIALGVIAKKTQADSIAIINWIIMIVFGLVNLGVFALSGFIKIDMLKQKAMPKEIRDRQNKEKQQKMNQKSSTKTSKKSTTSHRKADYEDTDIDYSEDYDVQETYDVSTTSDSSSDYTASYEYHEYR